MKQYFARTWLTTASIAAIILLLLAPAIRAQTATEQIAAESLRLRQLLPTLKLADNETASYVTLLNLIDTATQTGNLYQGLYYLQRAEVELLTSAYAKSKTEIEKQSMAAFESEWLRVGQELATKKKQLQTKTGLPAAVQGLSEASLTQVEPYYQSGRLYGRNTTIGAGLYYVGRAPANLDFALFCRQLKFGKQKAASGLGPIDKELAALETAAIKGFQDPVNESKQSNFIQINSMLKMARELNDEKRYAGALLKYLDALLEFGLVNAAVPDSTRWTALKGKADELHLQLDRSSGDQSIGLLYVELAQTAKSDAALKRAAIIIEQVLPAYLKFQGETKQ